MDLSRSRRPLVPPPPPPPFPPWAPLATKAAKRPQVRHPATPRRRGRVLGFCLPPPPHLYPLQNVTRTPFERVPAPDVLMQVRRGRGGLGVMASAPLEDALTRCTTKLPASSNGVTNDALTVVSVSFRNAPCLRTTLGRFQFYIHSDPRVLTGRQRVPEGRGRVGPDGPDGQWQWVGGRVLTKYHLSRPGAGPVGPAGPQGPWPGGHAPLRRGSPDTPTAAVYMPVSWLDSCLRGCVVCVCRLHTLLYLLYCLDSS